MENYSKQSYEPIHLHVSNSGRGSIYGEPYAIVKNDLIAQNLLYLAYNEPVTETELSKAIGIPMAYAEPVIKKLVDGELMKRIGNKVYTDFMIYTVDDMTKHIPAQKKFIEENQDLLLNPLGDGLEKIRNTVYYKRFTEHQRNALELYVMADSGGVYGAFSDIYNAEQIFPDRPNGGKWIAFGNAYRPGEPSGELYMYGVAGRRWSALENYFESKKIVLFIYDYEGFKIKRYYTGGGESNIEDDDLLKLLYIIESGTNPERTGFNTELLKKIPWLVQCGILKYDGDGKPALDIPVMSMQEWNSQQEIIWDISQNSKNAIKAPLAEFLKDKKQEIPKHLTSVPLQKQFMWACNIFTMASVRIALKKGIINGWDYDDDSGVNGTFPYSMVFVRD